jgi:thymidylate synthase (FAD)
VEASATAVLDGIPVLDRGFVRLDACEADDLSVVNGARVSFGRRKTEMDDGDAKLVRFLMRDRHGSPFEHNFFRFHIKAPIFVVREWQRHRISSFNERSARYSEMPDEFYVPAAEDVRTQVGKPGAYSFAPVGDDIAESARETMSRAYEQAYAAYQELLASGVAREVARSVLPVALYTEFFWSVNARSLMNFVSLRNHDNAQREIRLYAQAVEQLFAERMPVTHASFVDFGRTAP